MPHVWSRRKGALPPPTDAVYVGRPSPWGNPYKIHDRTGGRDTAIARFRAYAELRLEREPDWLKPLRGKDVVCWCAPLPCHADVLLELANRVERG